MGDTFRLIGKRFWWIIGGAIIGVGMCAVCNNYGEDIEGDLS